ncbi:MAG TPA: hypothetical protein VJG66_01690 [Patescibacteria group bacterium]|nr:hypothetical protein [Patescibacteria group bacterium]
MTQIITIPEEYKNRLKFTENVNEFVITQETSIPSPYNWNELTSDEKLTAEDGKVLGIIMNEYKKGEHLSEEEFFDKLKK